MVSDPELSPDDVAAYTGGQLLASDSETARMLAAALAAARNDARWNVSPVMYGDVITLNGTGTNKLRLPTQNVINLHAVTSDGVALDPVNDVTLDCESSNLLIRNSGVWSNQYNGITVTMDHGFPGTAAAIPASYTGSTADDWRQAILALVESIAQITATGRPDYELDSKQVDDVVYRWGAVASLSSIGPTLSRYRLLYKWV